MSYRIVYLYTVATVVAGGACPIVCPDIAVAVHRCAYYKSAQSVVEGVHLHLYLGDVYGLCVAHCVGEFVLSGSGAVFYADELSVAVHLYVWVYAFVEDEVYSVYRVLALAVAVCEYHC